MTSCRREKEEHGRETEGAWHTEALRTEVRLVSTSTVFAGNFGVPVIGGFPSRHQGATGASCSGSDSRGERNHWGRLQSILRLIARSHSRCSTTRARVEEDSSIPRTINPFKYGTVSCRVRFLWNPSLQQYLVTYSFHSD